MGDLRSMKKENPTLPFELIHEILLRLPVRSLLRFKCVCKSWFSLISDPKFAESHFNLAAAPSDRVIMNYKNVDDNEFESVDIKVSLHDDSASHDLSIAFPDGENKDNSLMILCSCRGFMLLVNDDSDLFVWNPATRVRKQIPESVVDFKLNRLCGIGYDPSTDDYFFVHIALDYPDRIPHIEFFSFNTNTSYQIKGVNLRYLKIDVDSKPGIFFNGAIHWLVTSRDTYLDVIIAFNLTQKTLSEIHLSDELASVLMHEVYYLRVLGGCLSLCYLGKGDSNEMAEIWIMKDYKVQSSWTKTTVLPTHDSPNFH